MQKLVACCRRFWMMVNKYTSINYKALLCYWCTQTHTPRDFCCHYWNECFASCYISGTKFDIPVQFHIHWIEKLKSQMAVNFSHLAHAFKYLYLFDCWFRSWPLMLRKRTSWQHCRCKQLSGSSRSSGRNIRWVLCSISNSFSSGQCSKVIIIIVATKTIQTMFVVQSSWHTIAIARVHPIHLMNSEQRQAFADTQTESTYLSWATSLPLLSVDRIYTHHHHLFWYSTQKLILVLLFHWGVSLGNAVGVCSHVQGCAFTISTSACHGIGSCDLTHNSQE